MNNNMIVFGTVKVPGHEFIGTMSASQLMRITVDPRRTEEEKTRAADAALQATYDIRKQVQREFAGAKAKNVESYADYICRMVDGADGITPAIVLWTAEKLTVTEADGYLPRLELPWSIELVAIDGETQLAARFAAKAKNPKTQEMTVDVKICYDRSTAWAGQAFHDLNVFAIRPNAATAVAMDMRDPLTHVTRSIADMPFFANRIKSDRQLSKKSNGIATLSVLRSSLVCFSEGIGGVQYGNKSVPVSAERIPEIEAAAVEYYGALAKRYGPAMEDRLNTVIASPAVLAALGAVGHQLIDIPAESRAAKIDEILNALSAINWTRGLRWEGVCGKLRPNGVFSTAGGVKDSAGASYRALVDFTNPFYSKVRDLSEHKPQAA